MANNVPVTMAAIIVVAIVAVTYLVANGHDSEAVLALLGAAGAGGVLTKMDKVAKSANGTSERYAAAAWRDGYRAGYVDSAVGKAPPVDLISTRQPYLRPGETE